jgi:hypothetical protein
MSCGAKTKAHLPVWGKIFLDAHSGLTVPVRQDEILRLAGFFPATEGASAARPVLLSAFFSSVFRTERRAAGAAGPDRGGARVAPQRRLPPQGSLAAPLGLRHAPGTLPSTFAAGNVASPPRAKPPQGARSGALARRLCSSE